MPTIAVKDASGATVTINTVNDNGPAAKAASQSIVLATDHPDVPVSGPLTDTQMRATPVPVSGPMTDTQMRAAPVPVSGPLTDAALRASPVPVTGAMTFADSANLDAFARLRVSQPTLLLDSKQVGGTPDLLATTSATGVGAGASYSINRASTLMTVGPAAGKVIRQTKARAIYQPGKSLLLFQTFVMNGPQANLRSRVGYFDDKNGVFFQRDGTALSFVIRSYVTGAAVDTVIPQANWNGDKLLDGTGPSGHTLNASKANILAADLEWLGVGRVRFYFVIDGIPVLAHEVDNANNLDCVYMSNPNLPIRWEVEAKDGGIAEAATLESICGSMNSEGGYDITGITASTDMGSTAKSIPQNDYAEVIAIRLRAGFTDYATAFIQLASILTSTTSNFRWRIVLNPTETSAGTWSNVNTAGSVMEQNTTRVVTENTGLTISAGYGSALVNQVDIDERPVLTLGTTLAGVTDVISLQVRNLTTNQTESYLASLTWREVF
jgi:hypothetical protein